MYEYKGFLKLQNVEANFNNNLGDPVTQPIFPLYIYAYIAQSARLEIEGSLAWFEPYRRHCVVFLARHFIPCLVLLQSRKRPFGV